MGRKIDKPITTVDEWLKRDWTLISDALPTEHGYYFVMGRKKCGTGYEYSSYIKLFNNQFPCEKGYENIAWRKLTTTNKSR